MCSLPSGIYQACFPTVAKKHAAMRRGKPCNCRQTSGLLFVQLQSSGARGPDKQFVDIPPLLPERLCIGVPLLKQFFLLGAYLLAESSVILILISMKHRQISCQRQRCVACCEKLSCYCSNQNDDDETPTMTTTSHSSRWSV